MAVTSKVQSTLYHSLKEKRLQGKHGTFLPPIFISLTGREGLNC